jgi:hypothetical protein
MDKHKLELLASFDKERIEEYFNMLNSLNEEFTPGQTVWEESTGREFQVLTTGVDIRNKFFFEQVYVISGGLIKVYPPTQLTVLSPLPASGGYVFCPEDRFKYEIQLIYRRGGKFYEETLDQGGSSNLSKCPDDFWGKRGTLYRAASDGRHHMVKHYPGRDGAKEGKDGQR